MGGFDRRKCLSHLRMGVTTWVPLVLAVITFATPALSVQPRVVCYYTNWSVYRPGTARFNPQNINPYLCTHLVYAFGGFTKDNTLKPFDKYQDIEKGGYAKFNGLKTYNKNLKTLLAIGGWNEGSSRFSPMVASRDSRKEFVRNTIKFLRQNNFDGLDLDWEYPAARDGGKPKDRENYAKLVKELREEFERESEKTGKPRLLLTMAVPAGIENIQKGYDIETLNKYLDWMNLLSYDYHSAFEPAVNHHAPLYPLEEPNEYSVDNELNIDYTIKFYLENGVDRDKLVLGIPTYGRSYTLFNPDAVEIGSPADGPGEQGDTTREKGYLSYFEICDALKPKEKKRSINSESEEYSDEEEDDEEWTVMHPNPTAMGPVAYKGNQWVGYDDIDIVRKKAEYVAENGLGGIMFWSIDNDDFRGNCHGKPYPLIEAAKEAYILKLGSTDNIVVSEKPKSRGKSGSKRRNRPRTSSTTTTTTTEKPSTRSNKRKSGSTVSTTPSWNIITPEPPTTPDPGSDFKCTDEGFFPHPRDCKKYFWCLDSGPSNLGIVAHQFTCPSGLYFNKAADSCDFARNVLCKTPADTKKAPTTKAPVTKTTTTTTTTTTTIKPIRVSTKSSVLFRTTSTTPVPEEIEEYEDEDDEENATDDAEDPKVIKELIDLIKKVGGVEQLEKQLALSETSITTSGVVTSTPTSINKRLYQKVLERARGKSKYNTNSVTDSYSQNSRRGPQNEGLQPSSDQDRLQRKERPQYVTINRSRSSSTTTSTEEPLESEEIYEELESSEQQLTRGRAVDQTKVASTAKPLQYVNIRRSRPSTITVSDTVDDSASRNALFERVEPYVSVSEAVNSLDIASARRENILEYVTIRRNSPTTETTTSQYQISETVLESGESDLEREITSSSSQPKYTSILRTRSTTLSPVEEPSSAEPTTILSGQISSLLNSPTAAEIQSPEFAPSITTAPEAVEVSTTTSPSPELPTTTVNLPTSTTRAPSTTTSRRNGLRRRGSTTASSTTTPSPISTTQVSFRNYNYVRRRRPLSTPNEISSESEETGFSKNIRSTTPNSREANEEKLGRETGLNTRIRSKYRFSVEDSLPAAASPIIRGPIQPQFNKDEELTLTSIDLDSQIFVRKPTINDNLFEETASTLSNEEEDSEISTTTVDDKRPSILSRGSGRYSTSAVNEPFGYTTTESTLTQRRPIFARFTPRPFTRSTSRPFTNSQDISPRIPQRVPFGRSRLSSTVPSNIQGLQARRLTFPSRTSTTTTTTEQALGIDDEDLENKRDDIYLSESTIEEKEHEDNKEDEDTDDNSTKNTEIEKITTSGFSDMEIQSETVTNDYGPRKFKVIRRRPITSTISTETTPVSIVTTPVVTEITPIVPRRRKIIRKKLISTENKIEVTTNKSKNTIDKNEITSLTNYGEKTKLTTITTTTTSGLEGEEIQTEAKFESNKQQPKLNEYNKNLEFSLQAETDEENKSDELNMKDDSEHDQFSKTDKQQFNESSSFDTNENSEEEATKSYSKADQDQIIKNETDSGNINKMRFTVKMSASEDNVSHKNDTGNDDTINSSKSPETEKHLEDLPELDEKRNTTQINSTHSEIIDNNSEIFSEINAEEEDRNRTLQYVSTESKEKSVIVEISNDKDIDLSETPVSSEFNMTKINSTSEITSETTTTSTTLSTSSSIRTRLPYRPPKRLFTSTTESTLPSSSKTFSRKYNPGAYTSPATVEREPFRPTVTRRPLFSRTFTRRPYTTQTTKKIEEDVYSDEELLDEETLEEEPENPFVIVPPSQLFTRKPEPEEEYEDEGNEDEGNDDEGKEDLEEIPDDEIIYDEEQPQTSTVSRFTTTRRPLFKPRVVISNTFRTSTTTTELPRRQFGNSQNKTIVYNRFGSIKPVNETKKRVQNVPIGYNTSKPRQNTLFQNSTTKTISTKIEEEKITTTNFYTSNDDITTTDHDEYLSVTENTTSYLENNNVSNDNATTNVVEIESVTIPKEITNYTDEYLENTEKSVLYVSTQDVSSNVQTEAMTQSFPETQVTTLATPKHTNAVTESLPETTTTTPTISPIIKTQYNKLFSISRVVEVSSKQDKHHLNKNNETTLIEEGPIVIEKKPSIDKIGEVSRFSLIKIVEDDIPIYLTKLGHVYPVDNPPNNPIQIDEGRNARALLNYNHYPKESLVASESMNEAYRLINKVTSPRKESMLKREVKHTPNDDFLSYINEDKKTEKAGEQFPQWLFVPAAYEDEQNKKAKNFKIVSPHIVLSNLSTLPLEAILSNETPVISNKGNGDNENNPFYVYSATVPTKREEINTEKTETEKPVNPSKVVSEELKIIFDQTMSENKMNKSIIMASTQRSFFGTNEKITTSHNTELLNKKPAVLTTNDATATTTSELPITTELEQTESSTVKTFPLGTNGLKFPFVRKPIIKPSNLTRLSTLPKTMKKINLGIKSNSIQKTNITSTFTPSKFRFSSNRVQNVPVDVRNKANIGKFISKTFTTETPKSTTDRKTYTQPKRPTFRPAFVSRRGTTGTPTLRGDFL